MCPPHFGQSHGLFDVEPLASEGTSKELQKRESPVLETSGNQSLV